MGIIKVFIIYFCIGLVTDMLKFDVFEDAYKKTAEEHLEIRHDEKIAIFVYFGSLLFCTFLWPLAVIGKVKGWLK